MPRGNDAEHAALFTTQLMDQYGIHSNAEEMIQAHRATRDPALQKASMLAIDEDETEIAVSDLDAVHAKLDLPADTVVLSAAVRGNAVIAVVENSAGLPGKVVGAWNAKYKPPELSAEEAAQSAVAKRDRQVREEAARLRAEADERIAEVRAEEDARVQAEVARIREDADAELAKAVEAANDDSGGEPEKPNATDAALVAAEEHGIDLSTVAGSGKEGRITKDDVDAAVAKANAD